MSLSAKSLSTAPTRSLSDSHLPPLWTTRRSAFPRSADRSDSPRRFAPDKPNTFTLYASQCGAPDRPGTKPSHEQSAEDKHAQQLLEVTFTAWSGLRTCADWR